MTTVPVPRSPEAASTTDWSLGDSADLYSIPAWGHGYVAVNERGHVEIRPEGDPERAIDLFDLTEGLAERGYHTPLLFRFNGILNHRLREISEAFRKAIQQEEYNGDYRCLFPIKVNQQRSIVEAIRDIGHGLGFGLEAGSKPELLAVLGMTVDQADMPIVCNGFKDREFIETVILATKLGRKVIPVVEKFSELELIIELAKRYEVRPSIGLRVKLSSRGAGRWESSGGERSKFGLFISEVLHAIERLKQEGMADCLNLLHFHVGSQINDIRAVKNAVGELAHIYTELRRLGAGMEMIDIGGGLGVDYDGSKSSHDSSMNYSIDEYAADVVYRIKSVCDEAGVPHPTIMSESGRAMVAYASVLVFNVIGASKFGDHGQKDSLEKLNAGEDEVPQGVIDLFEALEVVGPDNIVQVYHDAISARDEVMSLFSLGYVSLPMRAVAERLFWRLGLQILKLVERLDEVPDELRRLPDLLSDIYFCNVSIFQSLPDSWAIDQLFPICPIHRLQERPTRSGILADLTCDSDGKIDRFVSGRREPKRTLELHDLTEGEPYYLAAFLVGAYQEILGDLHNLIGDTHAVHVALDGDGEVVIEEVIEGDAVKEVLGYVQIDHRELRKAVRRETERAVRAKRISAAEAGALMRFYEAGLDGYTYMEE